MGSSLQCGDGVVTTVQVILCWYICDVNILQQVELIATSV